MFSMILICGLPSSRHRDKDTEFVTLCKSLHVTDLVCDRAWALWKTVQESMGEVTVCIYVNVVILLAVLLKTTQ